VIDLMEALKRSLGNTADSRPAAKTAAKARGARSPRKRKAA